MSTIPEGNASTTSQLPRRLLPARVDEDLCLKQKWYYGFPIRYADYDKRLKGKKGRLTDRMFAVEEDFYHICAEVLPESPGHEGARFLSSEKGIQTGKVSKVESNPDQSKHLETGKTKVFDIELEFVNLRSEEYTGDSRIPTKIVSGVSGSLQQAFTLRWFKRFGTPLEDALRRDLTVNSLFYNVHTRKVEDHTGKGLQDLKDGIVRTPLPPRTTFLDDPLRVIRSVRFASRFGYDMVSELQDAARDPEIQSAIVSKISRERVGEELDKMMKGRDPLYAIQLIDSLSLHNAIFCIPPSITPTFSQQPSHPSSSLAAASILRTLLSPLPSPLPPLHPLFTSITYDTSTTARLYLACALTPFRGLTYTDAKGKPHPVVEAAIRECLKLGAQNHYLDGIPALFAAAAVLRHPVFGGPLQRVAIGLVLRDKCVHNVNTGAHWVTSTLFALVQELASIWDPETDSLDVERGARLVTTYNDFMAKIDELDLTSAADMKPVLTGRDVVAELGAKPGPWTGHALARVVEWQLAHPAGTKAECAAWLKAEHGAGRIGVGDAHAGGPTAGKRREGGGEKAKREGGIA
ncbi:poly A polymerase C-terminal region-like protein [Heliocybe sulcata]|uniref:Poly A polymerase C-terminal region-like protein n=1 Tax=Heliocybe sulcata TaxID=5364 RepID=A0A5C3NJ06_9AGAM|nr:poly A polymerase C-terminal region-like protein [Heliocybe sulcata]